MKAVNGVKVFSVGDCDCFFAPTKDEAIAAANKMLGPNWVGPNGDVELDEVIEYTDKQFDEGKIVSLNEDETIPKDKDGNNISIPCKQYLEELMSDGSKVGHFSTSEW